LVERLTLLVAEARDGVVDVGVVDVDLHAGGVEPQAPPGDGRPVAGHGPRPVAAEEVPVDGHALGGQGARGGGGGVGGGGGRAGLPVVRAHDTVAPRRSASPPPPVLPACSVQTMVPVPSPLSRAVRVPTPTLMPATCSASASTDPWDRAIAAAVESPPAYPPWA